MNGCARSQWPRLLHLARFLQARGRGSPAAGEATAAVGCEAPAAFAAAAPPRPAAQGAGEVRACRARPLAWDLLGPAWAPLPTQPGHGFCRDTL